MFALLAAIGLVGVYASEYVISLYSLAVYIDPDEVESLFPNISRRQRDFLKKLVGDPRAFVQIATVYKSFALIVNVLLMVLILNQLAEAVGINVYYLYPLGFALIWLLQLFCVEYLARQASRRAIRYKMPRYLWLITIMYLVLYPVVNVYRWALKRPKEDDQVTEEEKEDIVERAIETLADQAGIGEAIVEEDEKEMIGQIFHLDTTVVREIMVPRMDITAIDKSMSFKNIQKMVLGDGHSRYPVYSDTIDKIIGIVYVKDLFNRMPDPGEKFVIKDYFREPFFVPESKVIGELLREFQSRKLHLAVVLDEYGGVAGLVTLEDIVEEVFGEIRDEHDTEEDEFVQVSENTYEVDAGMQVEKLQDQLSTDYDQGEYDTVGGLIYDLVGSVPKHKAVVDWHELQFQVLKVEGQRIKRIRVIRRGRT